AEDGIRDRNVTGVQTCALPIYSRSSPIHLGESVIQRFGDEREYIIRLPLKEIPSEEVSRLVQSALGAGGGPLGKFEIRRVEFVGDRKGVGEGRVGAGGCGGLGV